MSEELSERLGISKARVEQLRSVFPSQESFEEFAMMTPEERKARLPTRRKAERASRDRDIAEWVAGISDGKIRILTVADLAWNHRLVRKALNAARFVVREFSNGSQWAVQSSATNKESQ